MSATPNIPTQQLGFSVIEKSRGKSLDNIVGGNLPLFGIWTFLVQLDSNGGGKMETCRKERNLLRNLGSTTPDF